MGVTPGKPLADILAFVARFRSFTEYGPLPPVILAPLRKRMTALAGEIADGLVFSSGCLSHMRESLGTIPEARRADPAFFIGNCVRAVISDDAGQAKALLRQSMKHYALMPNYRNYWKEAGYQEEMTAVESALADVALWESAAAIRNGLDRWRDAGIKTPVPVPPAADGSQATALRAVFDGFAD